MWKAMRRFFKYGFGRPKFASANFSLIDNHQLVSLFADSSERLIIFDLRCPVDIEQSAYVIPGALLTTRASVPDLAKWIPPEAVVVLYGAENIFAHADILAALPPDARFCLLEDGLKSWRRAHFPVESVSPTCVGNHLERHHT